MIAAPATAARTPSRSVSRTHPGRRRSVNEDRVLERPQNGFWAIADGMGGHSRGDVAATRLVEALGAVRHGDSGFSRVADVAAAVERVNAELYDEAQGAMGATLVALLLHEGHCACLWAGDSRAYRLRDGALQPLTRDHSHVQELIDAGALSESARRGHPHAHLITRAVGAGSQIQLERRFDEVRPDDVFLLCSDGLTTCLDPSALMDLLDPSDLDGSADALLSEALDQGASDNVSLILAAPQG